MLGLYPLLPDKMEVQRDDKGNIYYVYSRNSDENPTFKEYGNIKLKAEDVLHIPVKRMAARVSKDNFEAEVLQASIPVLVEFYSDSCIPCKQMSPILGDIEDDYEDRLKSGQSQCKF